MYKFFRAVCLWGLLTQPAVAVGLLLQTLEPPGNAISFGFSLAIDANQLVIGDPIRQSGGINRGTAYVFDLKTGQLLSEVSNPSETRGASVFAGSVAVDSGIALIGDPFDETDGPGTGQAYVLSTEGGDLVRRLSDPTPGNRGLFGFGVAADAGLLAAGAALSAANGVSAGLVYVFDAASADLLQTLSDPSPTFGDRFGASLALADELIVIGDWNRSGSGIGVGQAHLFNARSGELLHNFEDPTPTGSDDFGRSVAIGDGYVLVGAPGDGINGSGVGQAHLFDVATGALLRTLDDPTATDRDGFGSAVAVNGNYALVSAAGDDTYGEDFGQVHIFETTTGELIGTLSDRAIVPGPEGASLALEGSLAVIGLPGVRNQVLVLDLAIPEPSAAGLVCVAALVVATGCRASSRTC